MKHKKELSLSIACFLLSFLCFMAWNQERDENLAAKICPAVLRLHVIGASNSDQDQQVKLQVKSFVVKQISSWNASSKDELVLEVQNRQTSLAAVSYTHLDVYKRQQLYLPSNHAYQPAV